MAASPQQAAAFDLRSVSACPVRLGLSAQSSSASSHYTGVQYNHKPSTSQRTSAGIDLPSSTTQLKTLKLVDGDEQYIYRGTQSSKEHTYILIPDEDGDGYTLERLDSSFHFNLAKAPWESNATKLAQQYTQLSHMGDNHEDQLLLGNHSDDDSRPPLQEDADPDNPFDYRHYLNASGSPSPQMHPIKSSGVGTPSSIASNASPRAQPQVARTARKPTSAFAPQDKKTKPKPKPKQSERVQPPIDLSKTSPELETSRRPVAIPEVRLDRRASTRVAVPSKSSGQHKSLRKTADDELSLDMDDDGDLILEGDEPTSYRSNQRSLGLALSGTLGVDRGPRSLMSAASSPASHDHSPHQPRGLSALHERHVDTDGEDVEMEDESADEDAEAEADAESAGELLLDESDADVDVDEMHLPSPAQVHRPSVSNTVVTAADDDDDLENQMLLALEGGDDDVLESGQHQHADSEEESEEE